MTATIVGPGGVVDQGEAGTEAWPVSIAGEINVDVDTSGLATQATLADVLAKLIAAPATEATVEAVRLLLVDLAADDDGIARDTTALAIRDRLPSALDGGALSVSDAYTAGEPTTKQTGAAAVLTFTLSTPRDLIWVRSVGGVSFADPFGGTPADGTGLYCADDEPHPITVRTSSVKVWAPVGAVVYLWAYGG